MKKFSLLFTTIFPVLLICYNGFSQVTQEWAARYNGPDNKNDQARLIAIDGSGNLIVTGTSGIKKGGFANITTVKYNAINGAQQYVARYKGPTNTTGNEYPYALAVDNAGNVYVTGRSMGSGSNVDIVTIKYNSSLGEEWVRRYNGPENLNDIPADIKVDAQGNVYVTGHTGAAINGGGGTAMVTLKYNSSSILQPGFPLIHDELPNDGSAGSDEQGTSLDLDGDGNIYVAGNRITIKYNPAGQRLWTKAWGRKVLIDAQNNVLVVRGSGIFKYDANGILIWQTDASLSSSSFTEMVMDGAGNVYVAGFTNGINDRSDYLTAKYNPDGTEQWIKSFNGSLNSTDIGRSIALDVSGNVYVTGYTSVNNGSRNGGLNYGTIKYNNNGVQQWLALYDSPDKSGSHAFGVVTDAAGNVYVTGESAAKATSLDYATVKYSQGAPSSKSITSTPTSEISNIFQLRNFPNPFIGNTTIEYQLPVEGKVRLSVYDLSGKQIATLVNEFKPAGVHRVNFAGNKLSTGTYFYRFQSGEYIETKKLIILR